jgi:uncharacterized protein
MAAMLCALGSGGTVAATPNFPTLTGRVVDQANLISATERSELEGKLKALEDKTRVQLVVATVSSLDDEAIEPYATALFNTWRLGQEKKNNGVLLLIAPSEHKVRIEVGYGLEATLTNAKAETIIVNAIVPRFKAGDFDGGIARGVDDIVAAVTTDDAQAAPSVK